MALVDHSFIMATSTEDTSTKDACKDSVFMCTRELKSGHSVTSRAITSGKNLKEVNFLPIRRAHPTSEHLRKSTEIKWKRMRLIKIKNLSIVKNKHQ